MACREGIDSIARGLCVHPSLHARTQGLVLQTFNIKSRYATRRLISPGVGGHRSRWDQRLGLQLIYSPRCILFAAISIEYTSGAFFSYDGDTLGSVDLKAHGK